MLRKSLCYLSYMCHEIIARFQFSYSKENQRKSIARQNTHDVSTLKGQVLALSIIAFDITFVFRTIIGDDYQSANFLAQIIPGFIISGLIFYFNLFKSDYFEKYFVIETQEKTLDERLGSYLLVSLLYIIIPLISIISISK
jgi:hypothetical protein